MFQLTWKALGRIFQKSSFIRSFKLCFKEKGHVLVFTDKYLKIRNEVPLI